jgi:molybdopterin converting factor small subunit
MVNSKGIIDTTGVKPEQGFNWVREILKKSKEDSLNIKDEEFIAVNDVINKLERKYKKLEQFNDFMITNMTKSQQANYFKDIIEDKIKNDVIRNYINE